MHIKTVKATNPTNVVVQIPGFVINKWIKDLSNGLEVHYDEEADYIIIKPAIYGRERPSKKG